MVYGPEAGWFVCLVACSFADDLKRSRHKPLKVRQMG